MAAFAAGEGGEVHDAGAAAGLRGGDEMRGGGAGDAAHAADIEGDHIRPESVVGFEQGAAADEGAGVIDQDVEAAEEGDGLGDEGVALLGGGEIGRGAGAAAAEGRGFGRERARALATGAIVDEHVATRAEQVRADGETDALGAGGDEGAFAEKFMHGGRTFKTDEAASIAGRGGLSHRATRPPREAWRDESCGQCAGDVSAGRRARQCDHAWGGVGVERDGLAVLVTRSVRGGDAWRVTATAIFGVTLVPLSTSSMLDHRFRDEKTKRLLRTFDHAAIFC